MDTSDALIEPFTEAVATTLREMAGAEAVVRDVFRAAGREGLADVSVGLRLEAGAGRWVILSLPMGTAAGLGVRVLAGVGGEPDEDIIRDCAAELLNVIAGQAKALTFGTPHHFTLSTPVALTDSPAGVAAGRTVLRFDSDAGAFTLHLCPPVASAAAAGGGTSSTRAGG